MSINFVYLNLKFKKLESVERPKKTGMRSSGGMSGGQRAGMAGGERSGGRGSGGPGMGQGPNSESKVYKIKVTLAEEIH